MLSACNTDSQEIPEIDASTELELPSSDMQPVEPQEPLEEELPETGEVSVPVPNEVVPAPQPAEQKPEISLITSVSDALGYTIQHPEGYTLTPEEPGKDMLFYNENDALMMRIETFSPTEVSFEEVQTFAQDSMAAIAPNNVYESFPLAPYIENRTDIVNSAGYIINYESDQVLSIVYELPTKMIVLTLFDDYITGITDTFIEAGLTIH